MSEEDDEGSKRNDVEKDGGRTFSSHCVNDDEEG